MSSNPEKEEADARDDAAFADSLFSSNRLRTRGGKGGKRDDKDSAKEVVTGAGKKKKKQKGPSKKKKTGQVAEKEVDPGPAKKKPRVSKNKAAAPAVHAPKKVAQRGEIKKVTIPESPASSQTITSSVAEKGADPIKQVPNYEVLATFELQWNAGNFIHGAGMHLSNVGGSNGQVKSQALQNFVIGLVDDYVKDMSSDTMDEDVWTPEWAWVHMYWIMHQSTHSQQLGSYVSPLSPAHVEACFSDYSSLLTSFQMKTWSPESVAGGFWSTDVDNKNFGQHRCYARDPPCYFTFVCVISRHLTSASFHATPCTPGGTHIHRFHLHLYYSCSIPF